MTIEQVMEEFAAEVIPPKPIALDTPLRYSSAGACSRQLGYQAMRAETTNPMDIGGRWVTGIGTHLHEMIQERVQRLHPDAVMEASSQVSVWSGSADVDYGYELDEYKTVGGYKRDKLFGISSYGKVSEPAEPPRGNVLQLGLNMRGLGRDRGNLVYLANEPYSLNVAKKVGLSPVERVMKVFTIYAEDIERAVDDEIRRGEAIVDMLEQGDLPPREYADDDGEWTTPNPEITTFPCQYCAWRDRCIQDGA